MKIVFKRTNMGAALLGAFCCMCILFLITLYHDGGALHPESSLFFTAYLDGRSLLQKVFDPQRNDWGCYQARELSYFFDFLDAHVVAFLLKKQIIWFHSFTSLIFCGIMVFIQQYFTRKFFPAVPGTLVTVLSLFFVLAAPVSGLDYFRSAKYLSALGIWGAFFSGYAVFRWNTLRSRLCFLLSLLLMTLSDRQGFFFTAVFSGTVAVVMLYQSLKNAPVASFRMKFVTLAPLGVLIFGILNNLYITPLLVRSVNGYAPDFAFQREISVKMEHLLQGFYFFFGNGGNWFNNFTGEYVTASITGILLLGGIALELLRQHLKGCRRAVPLALCWGCGIIAMYICSVIMVARLDIIMKSDLFFGVYTITFLAFILALVIFTAAGAGKRFCVILLVFFSLAAALRLGMELAGDRFIPEWSVEDNCKMRQHVLKKALKDPGYDFKKQCMPLRMELFLKFYRERVLTKQ